MDGVRGDKAQEGALPARRAVAACPDAAPERARERNLLAALVSLRDQAEASALLADLLTPREAEDFAQRLEVARMLDAGVSYVRIQAATGASATTVARVARCLKYGSGGYRVVLDRLPRYETRGVSK